MGTPYPLSEEFMKSARILFHEEFKDIKAVSSNKGTLTGSPSFVVGGGVSLNGTTQYALFQKKFPLHGKGFVRIEFTPDFAFDSDAYYTLLSSGAVGSGGFALRKLRNADSNRLACQLGGGYVYVDGVNYSAYWNVGQRNVLVVVINGASSAMMLNGVLLTTVSAAMNSYNLDNLYVGVYSTITYFFDGAVHSATIGAATITTGDASRLHAKDMNERINLQNAVFYLPGENDYARVSDSKRVTEVAGKVNTVSSPVTEALLGDGVTSTTFPTKLTTRLGWSFDGGDTIDCGNNDSFNMTTGSADKAFTVFSVAKLISLTASAYALVTKGFSFFDGEYALAFGPNGSIRFVLIDTTASKWMGRDTSSGIIGAGSYYAIFGTYDGSGSLSGIKVYVNGIRKDSANYTTGGYVRMRGGTDSLVVGGGCPGHLLKHVGSILFSGLIDAELSPIEVAMLSSKLQRIVTRRTSI